MSDTVIEARGLAKRYGGAVAVAGLDLTVRAGEVFGLLGPNGSGKTTTILMLLGLTEPSGGSVRVLGLDPLRQPLAVKRRVGYLPDTVGFYDTMTARENLAYTARLAGIALAESRRRIDAALARVGLAAVADRRVATYSHGMRQRLGIGEVLVKQAELAILDEPTNGLDLVAEDTVLRFLAELNRRDHQTLLFVTHNLTIAAHYATHVALFHAGEVASGPRQEVLNRHTLERIYGVAVDISYDPSGSPAVTVCPPEDGP